jgi:hypothetical protein
MPHLSQYEKERLRREQRRAEPLPEDWGDWDTKYALMMLRTKIEWVRERLNRSDIAREKLDTALDLCDLVEKAIDHANKKKSARDRIRRGGNCGSATT